MRGYGYTLEHIYAAVLAGLVAGFIAGAATIAVLVR